MVGSRPPLSVNRAGCPTFWYLSAMRNFDTLTEREVIALAISLEEEDERTYADYAEGLREDFPASAAASMACARKRSAIARA